MPIRLLNFDLHILNMRNRMPFRYGIVTMTALPHLFLRVRVDADGRQADGIAAEGLAPKWFTKIPDSSTEQDIAEMLDVVQAACRHAQDAGAADSVFDLWQATYQAQQTWAAGMGHRASSEQGRIEHRAPSEQGRIEHRAPSEQGRIKPYPPLLWAFGVSLVERAIIDGFCRATRTTFAQAMRANSLGMRLHDLRPELAGHTPADLLPAKPLERIIVRHTVGLIDPLSDDDIPPADQVDDGLPQSLDASIRAYGLTHFKIKIGGDIDADRARLQRIAALLDARNVDYRHTLDGNETYHNVADFRALWEGLSADPALRSFLQRLLFVEQPFHRDIALSQEVGAALRAWRQRPPIIIDESDGELSSALTALESGYVGTSHKNCKGVFKGIANTCLIRHRQRQEPGALRIISGEDLCNLGPVALLEDLAVLATLGIKHAERNGHHYFAGLSMLPEDVQAQMLAAHADLYRPHTTPGGRRFPTLAVANGSVDVGSVTAAPFGPAADLDPSRFTPVTEWEYASLGLD